MKRKKEGKKESKESLLTEQWTVVLELMRRPAVAKCYVIVLFDCFERVRFLNHLSLKVVYPNRHFRRQPPKW